MVNASAGPSAPLLRPLSAEVVVLHCRGAVITRRRTTPGRGRESVQTLVAHRESGRWLFTDFHNSRYRPLPGLTRWWMRRAASHHQTSA